MDSTAEGAGNVTVEFAVDYGENAIHEDAAATRKTDRGARKVSAKTTVGYVQPGPRRKTATGPSGSVIEECTVINGQSLAHERDGATIAGAEPVFEGDTGDRRCFNNTSKIENAVEASGAPADSQSR